MYTPGRVNLAEYYYTQSLLPQLFQDTRTLTSVPAALSSSVGTQWDGRLWSPTPSQGTSRCTLVADVGLLHLFELYIR